MKSQLSLRRWVPLHSTAVACGGVGGANGPGSVESGSGPASTGGEEGLAEVLAHEAVHQRIDATVRVSQHRRYHPELKEAEEEVGMGRAERRVRAVPV